MRQRKGAPAAKGGRPPSGEPKDAKLVIYMTEADRDAFRAAAKVAELEVSPWALRVLRRAVTPPPPAPPA